MRIATIAGNLVIRPLSSTSLAETICDRVNALVPSTRAITVDITGKALMHWINALPVDVRATLVQQDILDVGEYMTMVAELNQLALIPPEPPPDAHVSLIGDRLAVILTTLMILVVVAIVAWYILTGPAHAALNPNTTREPKTAHTETPAS